MRKVYEQFAGRSIERINALSDGVFAIAMTLIVLDVHVPSPAGVHSDADLLAAVARLAPQMITYLMSFLTLGIFWVGQQSQLNHFERADRDLAWIHLAFLAAVATLPFTTHLLADFIAFRLALFMYWANILVLGLLLMASVAYADKAGLVAADAPPGFVRAIRRRIVAAQALYALGAVLCLVGTTWSIAVIVLVQLNYAIAPRIAFLRRAG